MKTNLIRSIASATALAAALLVSQLAMATPSGAVPWSDRVDLGGKANCISPTARVTKVELWAKRLDNGRETYHNATLDNGRFQRKYSARLSVPGAGVSVWAKVTCAGMGSYWTGGPGKFEVKRPKVGYSQTRNLCGTAGPCI